MDEADCLCDRVAIVDQGRILCEDSPAALKQALETGEKVEIETDRDLATRTERSIAAAGATNWRFVSPIRSTSTRSRARASAAARRSTSRTAATTSCT